MRIAYEPIGHIEMIEVVGGDSIAHVRVFQKFEQGLFEIRK